MRDVGVVEDAGKVLRCFPSLGAQPLGAIAFRRRPGEAQQHSALLGGEGRPDHGDHLFVELPDAGARRPELRVGFVEELHAHDDAAGQRVVVEAPHQMHQASDRHLALLEVGLAGEELGGVPPLACPWSIRSLAAGSTGEGEDGLHAALLQPSDEAEQIPLTPFHEACVDRCVAVQQPCAERDAAMRHTEGHHPVQVLVGHEGAPMVMHSRDGLLAERSAAFVDERPLVMHAHVPHHRRP
mmetsp:Transcript_49603/g.144192  ORF Transcript_49603/g.144192 Transcript_49603/m.144192 type:complete len:240 (-) Transcript_49603:420-1139(-)